MDGMKMDGMKTPDAGYSESLDAAANYGMEGMDRVEGRREAIGMRPGWSMGVEGLSTVVRILPPEQFDTIMNSENHSGRQMHDMQKK